MSTIPIQQTKKLTDIPGVGRSIANDLISLGCSEPRELEGQDPEEMYRLLVQQAGGHIDRCVLYVFRCAVYYASTHDPEPDKLLWWNWKDK